MFNYLTYFSFFFNIVMKSDFIYSCPKEHLK